MKVQRNQWYRVVEYYQNIINEKFLHQPLTPVTQHFIRLALDKAVSEVKRRETNPVWHIPVYPKFNLQTQTVSIEPVDQNSLELI
jgi:hypothetical protein